MTTFIRPITFASLHEAKRNQTLVSWLAEMTPAERVEAAEVCATYSRRTVSEWLATFGEMIEAAEVAIEEEAAERDSAAALAESQADTKALSPRCPRCKQLFDHLGRCGCDYEPTRMDMTKAIVLRGETFDALCEAVDEARAYWSHVPARIKVINDGWAYLLERNVIHCNANGDLLYPSESTPGLVHVVGVSCSCTAGRWGQHCKHAAAADLIGRARRKLNSLRAA
jgi:hypothetical protein